MKLTKHKLSKLQKINNQSRRKYKKLKKNVPYKTRKNKLFNLRIKTLKKNISPKNRVKVFESKKKLVRFLKKQKLV